jgi:hypothetical protein
MKQLAVLGSQFSEVSEPTAMIPTFMKQLRGQLPVVE